MSWFSKNYEKAALGGAVAVALGLAYLGWSKFGGVEEEFGAGLKGAGNNNAAVLNADLISKALVSMKRDLTPTQGMAGERPVDLFTGIPLFVTSTEPDKPLDPYSGPLIHPPILNAWWNEHRLDPGFADSPNRDPDEDGFSNLEEYNAKTDPNDSKSVPSLIAKLLYIRDESLTWVIRPTYGDNGSFPFKYQDTKGGVNQTGAADMVAPNGLFFAKGVMANRFKLLGSEVRKELSKNTNIEVEVTYVRIEDQRANKKGTVYEFPAPLSEERMKEHVKYDRTAIFSLQALGYKDKEFKVEENTTFALPPDGAKKDYLAKTVTPESVTIEYTDPAGEKKTVEIKKGSMPDMGE
ncbi:MAG: Amuc_1099 family pilus-like system protein [Verrucomicrobiota bacterium]